MPHAVASFVLGLGGGGVYRESERITCGGGVEMRAMQCRLSNQQMEGFQWKSVATFLVTACLFIHA